MLRADKGKKFVVMEEHMYMNMADEHLAKDTVTSPDQVRESQRILSSTARGLVNVFGVGLNQSHANYVRCMDNAGSQAEDVPTMKLLPKIHKPLGPGGCPKSRPVVTASSGMSTRAGDILADVLEPLVMCDLPRYEDQSTEEVLHQLETAQENIREGGHTDTVVGSLDVVGLYPNIDQREAAEIVGEFVNDSSIEIKDVDWSSAVVFLASNMSEDQVEKSGQKKWIPARTKKKGKRPGPTSKELGAKKRKRTEHDDLEETIESEEEDVEVEVEAESNSEDENDEIRDQSQKKTDKCSKKKKKMESKWCMTDTDSMPEDVKKKILAKIVCISVLKVFSNHMYQYGGSTYRQNGGGATGLRLTSLVARIVMDRWARTFLVKAQEEGLRIELFAKYVDDINVVMGMLDLGNRWINDRIVHCSMKEAEDREAGTSREDVTMECVRGMADSVVSWLKFTKDHLGLHASGMVPILDIQVWVSHPKNDDEDGLGNDVLGWMFYEKPVASSKVLRADSAYTWRSKITTMSMELFRRLRNSTRQLTLDAKVGLITRFVDKLRMSGYSASAVRGIIESGTKFYYRKLRIELNGGPRVNERK